jgi:nitroimidazol reductase NimA-like FMN-containing flavoprotein (pyridoxamine 5'-phosphate oxidase superfamily)
MNGTLHEARDFLEQVRIPIRLACLTPGGWPALISLWYIYQDSLLYCATQESAKIIRYLENNNQCAFEIAADDPPYCGIRGKAIATVDDKLGEEMLEKLLLRYLGDTKNDLARNLLAKKDAEVAIVLEPTSIYSWDFRERMKDIGSVQSVKKVCP